MIEENFFEKVAEVIKKTDSPFDVAIPETSIILAAGHGKRIKSKTSKMLHKIYETPTVQRVFNACREGLENSNTIMVVGIKADEVVKAIGKNDATIFAHQQVQHGTGHAVQVGLEKITNLDYDGTVYILPGDMGLLNAETMKDFKEAFESSNKDMMVLTGLYEGPSELNAYGRIVRVKETDIDGNSSGEYLGNVIEIKEHKDILSLDGNEPYILEFSGKKYSYTKQELIDNNEFNSGVFAFKYKYLVEKINKIESNNAQSEIYVTDLIAIFNQDGLSVGAVSPKEQYVLMGFNDKTVLKEMNAIARKLEYEKIKNIIEIEDPEDFFIHSDVIKQIVEMDTEGIPLDIKIGKGSYVGKGTKINYNLSLSRNVHIEANVLFDKNVFLGENVSITSYPNQKIEIGENVNILAGNVIKGNSKIGKNTKLESRVNVTGSDEHPLVIGNNVIIKGTSYIYGSIIPDDTYIEHSVLLEKRITETKLPDNQHRKIRFYTPLPEGVELVDKL